MQLKRKGREQKQMLKHAFNKLQVNQTCLEDPQLAIIEEQPQTYAVSLN